MTTIGAVCFAAIGLAVLVPIVAVLRTLALHPSARGRVWRLLWLAPVSAAIIVTATLLLQRDRRQAEAAQHVARAKDLKEKGLTERAEREAERALKLNPKNEQAEKTLRDIKERQEEQEREAERRRTQAIPTGPGGGGGGPGMPPRIAQPRVGLDIEDYQLEARLEPARHQLKATATLALRPRDANAREITLLLSPALIVSSVRVEGKTARFKSDEDRLIIQLPSATSARDRLKVTVAYDGFGQAAALPSGDRIAEDGCFLRPESQWYPSTHLFDFLTPVTLSITVPAKMTAIGSGELTKPTKTGDATTFVWRCKLPIRAIVTAAATYKQQRRDWRGVEVSVWTFPQHADRAARYFGSMTDMLEYFSGQFGPYPFTKFALVEIPQFPGGYGAPSFVMCYDKVIERGDVDEGFIAHEIAHQWWGHAVGVDGPGAGWLCEGFAEYSSCMYEAHARGPEALRLRLNGARDKYLAGVGGVGGPAIAETDPFYQVGGYPGVIYHKGAYVLHMLRTVLGDELFSRCMTDYALAYRGKTATLSDFENACTRAAGTSLDWFFDEWVYQPGAMELTYDFVSRKVAGGKHLLRVAVQQETKEPYRMPLEIAVKTPGAEVRKREMLDSASAQFEYRLDQQPVSVTLDPDGDLLMPTPTRVSMDALRTPAPRRGG